nr:flagellar motor switch protein FliM [Litorivivens lipolytica]
MGGLETGELETGEQEAVGVESETAVTEASTGGKAKSFDYSKHHYALHRLLPKIREVHSNYAEALQEKIGKLSSSVNKVEIDELTVTDLDELSPRIDTPCRLAIITAKPIASPVLLAIESDLVFDIVNRYFGGGNSLRKTRLSEKFSSTEMKLSELLVEDMVTELAPAWQPLLDIAPTISGWEFDPRSVDALDEKEALIATRFKVNFDNGEGGIWVVVPWHGLEPLRGQLKTADNLALPNTDPNWQPKFVEGLEEASVELVAVLSEQKIKLKHAMQLKKGDVIAINDPKEVDIKVGCVRLMRAHFGTHEGNMAAQVLEILRSPMANRQK